MEWRALGVVVWDDAGSHRAGEVGEVGVLLVYLSGYLSEWTAVARVFCEVGGGVAGVVDGSLEAEMALVEGALGGLCDDMVR